jgi:ribosomal protein S18 acetylase RimI-like enzyme
MGSGPRSCADDAGVRYGADAATREQLEDHLRRCDARFIPPLGGRVDIAAYAAKIRQAAVTFEAWRGERLVGLVAAYLNDPAGGTGFVTSVSVEPEFAGRGIGEELMHNCLRRARERGFGRLVLEVGTANDRAIALYRRLGFEEAGARDEFLRMTIELKGQARNDG